MRTLLLALAALTLATSAVAQTPTQVDTGALLAANTRPFSYADGKLAGPGADFMFGQLPTAQFVFLGESHHDRQTPIFAGALYGRLKQELGYRYLAVEQDPLAIDAINTYRGDLSRIVALSKTYPTHIGFSSDQDLALLALVSKDARSGDPSIWGLEQAQGVAPYLEELVTLASNAATRATTQGLLDEARLKETRANQGAFIHDDPTTLSRLTALKTAFAAKPGSRADVLLTGLVTSARIYSYNRRANAGERVGLYNNTEREALFKRSFMTHYRQVATAKTLPRVMFKFGSWHGYRGRSPGGAFTIANFAHEFAIANGREAYGIVVVPTGGYEADVTEEGPWMKALFPDGPPKQPVILDLRAIQPWSRVFVNQVPVEQQGALRDYIFAHDAVVVLPNSAKASWDLTGFPVP
ncbi:MAG: hypothetical protein KA085_06675 [Phenylobacterium sp.]|uniref:hypothetical protein n=1 Tax=Phenylobacterium sp. TaxID=1871053 RepID=UPI001B6319CF|nr:hypothetical protein [Phenylobacterium sp.]MBP7649440.1 hypothetical protein [Phenylobacterium sp.]MBP7815791.1 hypothetical protein [Phenylobacterium sp.]MBP9231310.1 hypothetical protein [Phenylobacterium sp.]MBP9754634.1 hypothetical protein [Phenylobacterium sp.]